MTPPYHQGKTKSKLKEEEISDEDYQFARNIWNICECKCLKEYHDLYLKADLFENFRRTCHKAFRLDPAHHLTARSSSWDAMLKMTQIELELLSASALFGLIEKGLRGVSMITKRYPKANHKYLQTFDPQQANNFIIYLDANNLYGNAMSQPVPFKEFQCVESEHAKDINFLKLILKGK